MKTTLNADQRQDFAGIIGGKEYGKLIQAILHLPQFEDTIVREVATSLQSIDKPLILDMGCGEGMTTIALCRQIRGATIIALDVAPKMLEEYTAKIAKDESGVIAASNNHIDTVCSDALSFLKKCASGSFDAVVSGFMLHNIEKPERAEIIAEVCRVLRPGRRFVNGDKVAHDDEATHLTTIMEQYRLITEANSAHEDNAYWLGWIEHYVRDNHPDIKMTEHELTSNLTSAGFENIKLVARMRMEAIVSADKPAD